MNRGFCRYFQEGVRASARSLYKNFNLFRYFAYFFMELLARVTLVFSALFDLANVRQGKLIRKEREVRLSQSFRDASRPSTVWTYVLTVAVEALLFLAGLIVLGIVVSLFALVGFGIGALVPDLDDWVLPLVFSVPGLLVTLVYLVVLPLIFAPTPYIVANNPNIGVGDTLSACFNTMKSAGKLTLFLNTVVPFLIKAAILAVLAGGGYWLGRALQGEEFLALVLSLYIVIAVAGFALSAPIFTLATRTANERLFEDVVLDPVTANKTATGIHVKHCTGGRFAFGDEAENLAELFETVPEEQTPAAPPPPAPLVNLGDARQVDWRQVREAQPSEQAEPNEAQPLEKEELSPQATEEDSPLGQATEPLPEETYEPAPIQAVEPAPMPEPAYEPIGQATESVEEAPEQPTESVEEEPAPVEEAPEQPTEPTGEESAPVEEAPEQPTESVGEEPAPVEEAPEQPTESVGEEPAPVEEAPEQPTEPNGEEPDSIEAEFPSEPSEQPVKKKSASASKLLTRLKKGK